VSDTVNSSDQYLLRVPATGKMYTISAYSPRRSPAWIRSARAALSWWVADGGGDQILRPNERVQVKVRGRGDWAVFQVE
jgi:hypothetical protein